MEAKNRSIADNKRQNSEVKSLKEPQPITKVALDSGAIARLPQFEQPVNRRGPFDIGLLPTWILYIILFILVLTSVAGLALSALGLNSTLFGVPSTTNQQMKLFALVISSTTLTSSGMLLCCFCLQHAKEVGWVPSPEAPNEKKNPDALAQNAKINALYSIDPSLQQEQGFVSPSHLSSFDLNSSTQQLIAI